MADFFGDSESFTENLSATQTTNSHSRHHQPSALAFSNRNDHARSSSMSEMPGNRGASQKAPRAAESEMRTHTSNNVRNGLDSRDSSGQGKISLQKPPSDANAPGMSHQRYPSVFPGGVHGPGTTNVHSGTEQGSRNMPESFWPFDYSDYSAPVENDSLPSLVSRPEAMHSHSSQSSMTWPSSALRNKPDDTARTVQTAHASLADKIKTKHNADGARPHSSVPSTSFGAKRVRPGAIPAASKPFNAGHREEKKHESISGKHALEDKTRDAGSGDNRNVRACTYSEAPNGDTDSKHLHAAKAHKNSHDHHTTKDASERIEDVRNRPSPTKTSSAITPKQSAAPSPASTKLASAGQKEVTSKAARPAEPHRPKESTSTHVTPEKTCATTKRSLLLCLGDMSGGEAVCMIVQMRVYMQNHML
jgi:hypothetical protein